MVKWGYPAESTAATRGTTVQALQVWNMFSEDVDDPDCHRDFVGTYASLERARAEVDERHPAEAHDGQVEGYLTGSGGLVHVLGESGVPVRTYVIRQTEVVS